jgi:hypothetical protein
VKFLVAIPDAEREKYGIQDRLLPLDFDAILNLPFDEVVALEEAMVGGPSLFLLRMDLAEYSAKALRAVAWLAIWQHAAGKPPPPWAEFKPSPAKCFYVLDRGDAVPPDQGSGDSSTKGRARTSSRSARTSRSSTTSPRIA